MNVRFFNPGLGYLRIKDEVDREMQRVLEHGDLILRKDVDDFEDNLKLFLHKNYAVAVASGTDALILTLKALGIGRNDEVIVPSYTFRATVEAVHHVGAKPVLADLGKDWRDYRTNNTKAVIPAHIAGELLSWTPDPELIFIEDSAQAIGAGDVGGIAQCYSFYPAKILGCYGDGGAVVTNDKTLADRVRLLRNHNKGDWKDFGYNSRLDNLQAAVLNVKIKNLAQDLKRRKEIAEFYDLHLQDISVIQLPKSRGVYQDYIIDCMTESAAVGLKKFLGDAGVEVMTNGYPFPTETPKQPLAEAYESRSLRIPCNVELTNQEITYVASKIKEFFGK